MNNDAWIIIDTETDGLFDPIHVIEIAAQRMKGWQPAGEPFQVFLDHNVHIPPCAVAVHGYTREFIRQQGEKPRVAHERFRDYVDDLPIVAHNIAYDWNRALVPEWRRLRIPQVGERGFCTMTLSRRVTDEIPNYKLDTLKAHFKLGSGISHQAANDVATVVGLCRKVIGPRLEPLCLETFSDVAAFSRKTPVAKCLDLVEAQEPVVIRKRKRG